MQHEAQFHSTRSTNNCSSLVSTRSWALSCWFQSWQQVGATLRRVGVPRYLKWSDLIHTCDNFLGHSLGFGCLARWISELLAGSYMTHFLELAGF
jgi:hypothetical protein